MAIWHYGNVAIWQCGNIFDGICHVFTSGWRLQIDGRNMWYTLRWLFPTQVGRHKIIPKMHRKIHFQISRTFQLWWDIQVGELDIFCSIASVILGALWFVWAFRAIRALQRVEVRTIYCYWVFKSSLDESFIQSTPNSVILRKMQFAMYILNSVSRGHLWRPEKFTPKKFTNLRQNSFTIKLFLQQTFCVFDV